VRNPDELFDALAQSTFRRRFKLSARELAYANEKGLAVLLDHARDFIRARLAPADIPNDGKQTPMRNHPVFVAQHATATCCRGCLAKWHQIAKGRERTEQEIAHVAAAIARWLRGQGVTDADPQEPTLFPP
jgi:hypothetical protein